MQGHVIDSGRAARRRLLAAGRMTAAQLHAELGFAERLAALAVGETSVIILLHLPLHL